ncbi:L-glutamate gamma-semialdehyde dehydrogenase [Limnobacter sp.]|uniref:L-glutamate gamma-semialdehyde dehydrogenase n=1 Tax=Limnobacter sp. TaxID=2003368 RepID=UPI003517DBBB
MSSALKAVQEEFNNAWLMPETDCVQQLLKRLPQTPLGHPDIEHTAITLATAARARHHTHTHELVQDLLQEYQLSTDEGLALMCLAEALLRIPDATTRNALIEDCLQRGDWQAHMGHSHSWLVNVGTLGLALTQGLQRLHWLGGMVLVRKATEAAMTRLGKQFVLGQSIEEALTESTKTRALGYTHSYDMLGEAAVTYTDAEQYFQAYLHAIEVVGQQAQGKTLRERPGVSIKLSALHPRYVEDQGQTMMNELLPKVIALAMRAQAHHLPLHIDAEESERLQLSMDVVQALYQAPKLHTWQGLGVVIQAYQKRALCVVQWACQLARLHGKTIMVRLVKGAYWDSEIKRAQVLGLPDYPVFSRKAHTDLSYLACANVLLQAGDAVYPQFATHNAHTIASVLQLAQSHGRQPRDFEFQCLHGMGENLYHGLLAQHAGHLDQQHACRIYAPVGPHQHLLAYLVRRLLENGANASFVNQLNNPAVPVEQLTTSPLELLHKAGQPPGKPHPQIPIPPRILLPQRLRGVAPNMACRATQAQFNAALLAHTPAQWSPTPLNDVEQAAQLALQHAPMWASQPAEKRAQCLRAAASALQSRLFEFAALLVHEAHKTRANAVAEVQEAIDFLYFYAAQLEGNFCNTTHKPLGVVLCISPWNFPLAIFLGQVSAALAAGNAVLAKPADQTPHVAMKALEVLWNAGVPRQVLHGLPGPGHSVGAALANHPAISGVLFTGSVQTAATIHANINKRRSPQGLPIRWVAETGGQNAMVVDSSALLEQVVHDVLLSAFDSAGQRCSALRILVVQQDIAPTLLDMLEKAMRTLRLGPATLQNTDIGPVIDPQAAQRIQQHLQNMRQRGARIDQCERHLQQAAAMPHTVAPAIIEIHSLHGLEQEVFGPVLHVLPSPLQDIDQHLLHIRQLGFGLTFGVHSRIQHRIDHWVKQSNAGNIYVNRNMVGAVVGVQPFGGHGLSGTGPKAGGPQYLLALLQQAPSDALSKALQTMGATLLEGQKRTTGAQVYLLKGPTGEQNLYCISTRDDQQQPCNWLHEQTICTNTAAAGGNASLLALSETENPEC